MRVKRHKQHRRAVRFYTACFGFREPFKVLCDGTFIHHLQANGITPADTALAKTLGAGVKLFTTRCVLAELRRLGASFSDSLNAASKLITARCEHEKSKSGEACLLDVIGENNPEHFFVATQDAELRKQFQEIPGVPLIYALRNALLVEHPSAAQRNSAMASEEARSHMTDLEYQMLKKKRSVPDVAQNSSILDEDDGRGQILETEDSKTNTKRSGIDGKDKVQFKRKRAKGPNPLSCKKKKIEANVDAKVKESSRVGSLRSRRKRKRSRKSKKTPEISA